MNAFVADLIGHVIFGCVIQEVKTSNVAREVGTWPIVSLISETVDLRPTDMFGCHYDDDDHMKLQLLHALLATHLSVCPFQTGVVSK